MNIEKNSETLTSFAGKYYRHIAEHDRRFYVVENGKINYEKDYILCYVNGNTRAKDAESHCYTVKTQTHCVGEVAKYEKLDEDTTVIHHMFTL